MKGLLLKDFYVATKSCKMYFIVDIIFIVMAFVLSGSFDDSFMFLMLPVITSGMLGVSLMSFDEKFKWTKYSGALPYSPAQIVLSKYLFGFIYQVFTALIVFLALVVWTNIIGDTTLSDATIALGRIFTISLIIPSVSLPFCFKFGTEKGRIFYMAFVFGFSFAFFNFADKLVGLLDNNKLVLIIIAAVVVLYAVSMAISIAVYGKREITD